METQTNTDMVSCQHRTVDRYFKKPYTLSLGLFTFIILALSFSTANAQDNRRDIVDEGVLEALRNGQEVSVIIALEEPATLNASNFDLAALQEDVRQTQEAVLDDLSESELRVGHQYQSVPAFSGRLMNTAGLTKLLRNELVIRVELDLETQTSLDESVPLIGADTWHNDNIRGDGIVVAVLDTGIDTDHPDLADSIIHEECFLDSNNSIDGIGNCPNGSDRQSGAGASEDDGGHGTHVSGIITSNGTVTGVGVAPNADIVSIKVLGLSGGTFSDLIAALDFILNNPQLDVQVINMSLGSRGLVFPGDCDADRPAEAAAIDALYNAGVTVIAAAGNDSASEGMNVPACIRNTISVGNSDKSDVLWSTSNRSPTTDIFAPGAGILASGLNGGSSIRTGTSMASPHAAGCAAILIQAGEATTPDALETRLETSNVTITDPANTRTYPRIDCSMPAAANTPPVADFSFTTIGLTVNFTDSSTDSDGTVVAWNWSFGDGNGSSVQNPSHTYAAPGTYTVTLTVTDNMGATATISKSVTVTDPTGGTMYIASITNTIVRNQGSGTVESSFLIVDNNGAPVEGATVEGLFSGDLSGSDTGLTDANGIAVLTSDSFTKKPKDLGICAVDVTHPTLTYDPNSNADITFACPATQKDLAVTAFILIDADTDQDLFELTDGVTLDLDQLPRNLNVRAETTDDVESVLFSIDPQGFSREENLPPFSLFGDINIDDYLSGTFENGEQTLSATPYSEDNRGGDEGTTLSITIHILNGTHAPTVSAETQSQDAALSVLSDVPTEYALGNAYPNPFNPETTITFSLPESVHVQLVVYDVLGQQVATLVDGSYSAGHHEVRFQAADLPSGTYLYRLVTPRQSFTETMLLLK